MRNQVSSFKYQVSKETGKGKPKYKNSDLTERITVFAESVITFCRSLRTDSVSRPIISQVVRSATSIGANYSEASNASSTKDFRNKVYIAKKESQETAYWLRLLDSCYPDRSEEIQIIRQESYELTLILQAIVKKVDSKMDKK